MRNEGEAGGEKKNKGNVTTNSWCKWGRKAEDNWPSAMKATYL